jgi:hypothetical protein
MVVGAAEDEVVTWPLITVPTEADTAEVDDPLVQQLSPQQ